ncbi:hypothetical protein FDH38_gp031 [Dinoroseobacter phage vB_DshS-R5C]|uniref:Uncharacterized protein n=1 Tax=Dinoroseobacter phage vB_DshS-R5C TaxID=1965368 RepID=A0A1V0DY53_9CAUD|nr:hypothetical protein FDH38_gp031 [Dinoroseobacter phage vB_DshS-R5C]ARB06085.1 hypothetical protein vBDshSR5C_31 [Dinoroseobacter phage vB_DshS-R5C]
MIDILLNVIDDIRDHPWEFVGDVIGAVCLFATIFLLFIFAGVMS